MAVTIRSVAEEADVSPATVSRVFNNTAPVDDKTRERILEAADKLGYVPNATARSLSTRETHTFGVLLPYLTGEYFPEVIRGLDEKAQEHGRFLLVSSSHHTPEDTAGALQSMYGRVDGLILMAPQLSPSELREYLPPEVPVVLLNSAAEGHELNVLSIDNRKGGRLATEHLIEQGHERIAIITGEVTNYDARERLAGYRAAMKDAGLSVRDEWVVSGAFSRSSGEDAMEQLLRLDPAPTAVFVSNDYMAFGAMHALREAGLAVPDDVAIVGFDDIPSAEHFSPSLSSVDARMVDVGTGAIDMLVELTESSTSSREVRQLDPVLRIRASSNGVRNGREEQKEG